MQEIIRLCFAVTFGNGCELSAEITTLAPVTMPLYWLYRHSPSKPLPACELFPVRTLEVLVRDSPAAIHVARDRLRAQSLIWKG